MLDDDEERRGGQNKKEAGLDIISL